MWTPVWHSKCLLSNFRAFPFFKQCLFHFVCIESSVCFALAGLDPGSNHVSKGASCPRIFWKLLLTVPLTRPGAGFQEDQFLILLAIPARPPVVEPPPTVDSMRIGLRFFEEVAGLDEGWLRGGSS